MPVTFYSAEDQAKQVEKYNQDKQRGEKIPLVARNPKTGWPLLQVSLLTPTKSDTLSYEQVLGGGKCHYFFITAFNFVCLLAPLPGIVKVIGNHGNKVDPKRLKADNVELFLERFNINFMHLGIMINSESGPYGKSLEVTTQFGDALKLQQTLERADSFAFKPKNGIDAIAGWKDGPAFSESDINQKLNHEVAVFANGQIFVDLGMLLDSLVKDEQIKETFEGVFKVKEFQTLQNEEIMISEQTIKLKLVLAELAKHNQVDIWSYLEAIAKGNSSENRINDDLINQAMELIEQGADLSATDGTNLGYTLFHYLVAFNLNRSYDKQINSLLRLQPSLINQKNGLGRTPLFELLYNSMGFVSLSYVKYLVQLGSQLDVFCPLTAADNCTLLHIACLWGNKVIAKYLIDQGLNIDEPTSKYRNTPLIMAAAYNKNDMIRFLILSGANISLTDYLGRTVRDYQTHSVYGTKSLELFDQYVQEKQAGVVLDPIQEDGLDAEDDDPVQENLESPIKQNAITIQQYNAIESAMKSAHNNLSTGWFVSNYDLKDTKLNDCIKRFKEHYKNNQSDMANSALIEFAKIISSPRGGILNFYKANYGETSSALAFYQSLINAGLNDLVESIKERAILTPDWNVDKYDNSLGGA